MPNQKRRRNAPPARRSPPRRTPRRRTTKNSLRSQVITTLRTKTAHKQIEVYPISLDKLVSRANVGTDVDITLSTYSLSVTIATGNDLSSVSANIGHSGPWVRRGDNQIDTFNQQSSEHNFSRSKTVIFKVKLHASERQYFNPDTNQNFVDLRISDPCGVIPGTTLKIEARATLIRKVPSATFPDGNMPATDRYEDQDVSTGVSSGQPQPPSSVQDVPLKINDKSHSVWSTTDKTSPLTYRLGGHSSGNSEHFTVTAAGKLNIVGEITLQDKYNPQAEYTAEGFAGKIVRVG